MSDLAGQAPDSLLSNLSVGIFILLLDQPMRLLYANQYFREFSGRIGIDPESPGRWEDSIYPGDREVIRKEMERILQEGPRCKPIDLCFRLLTRDGAICWTALRGKAEQASQGAVFQGITFDHSAGKEAVQALKVNEERFRLAFSQSPDVIWEYCPKEHKIFCPELYPGYVLSQIAGFLHEREPEEIAAGGCLSQDSAEEFLRMIDAVRLGAEKSECVIQIQRDDPDGSASDNRWLRLSCTALRDRYGHLYRVIGLCREITREKSAQIHYLLEKKYRDSFLGNTVFAYEVNVTEDRLIDGDMEWLQSMGMKKGGNYSELVRRALEWIPYPEHRKQFLCTFQREALLQAFQEERDVHCDYVRLNFDRVPRWVCAAMNLVREPVSGQIRGFIYIRDIDEQKKETIALKEKAERDPLTGLFNRLTAQTHINNALMEENLLCALMMLDIDNFKNINDTFGHIYGDAVLSELARILRESVRESDIVGRVGGDELVVFLRGLNDRQAAERKAEKICQALRMSFSAGTQQCGISCSLGIAFAPEDGSSFEDLYSKADHALYCAKRMGKNQYMVFHPSLEMETRTAHPRTKIDSDSNKVFSDNMVEYIFKILYHSENLEFAVTSVLELLARRFRAQHAYLLEYIEKKECYAMNFEWCDSSVKATKSGWNHIPPSVMRDYLESLGESRVLCVSDVNTVASPMREFYQERGVFSFLQCGIWKKSQWMGMIGFDKHTTQKPFTGEELSGIQLSAELIGTFLKGRREEKKREQDSNALKTVLDNLQNYIYVIHPETRRIVFINQKARESLDGKGLGFACYNAIMKKDAPCPDCPLYTLARAPDSSGRAELYSPVFGCWVQVTANWVNWPDGNRYCLVNCVDISQYKTAGEKGEPS